MQSVSLDILCQSTRDKALTQRCTFVGPRAVRKSLNKTPRPPSLAVIDHLLNKHREQKDMLKLVDQDYAALHNSCTDPNSMLHPTTKLHILQYVKHLGKLLNTSSSLNVSPEKLQKRLKLCHSLTEASETTSVPVVTMSVAIVHPPPPVQMLTQASIEKVVLNVMEKQQQHKQQQQQPGQKKGHTKDKVLSARTGCHTEKGDRERTAEEEEKTVVTFKLGSLE
uniref:uncharacterized protein LOC120833538 n=1 Tax=Gasterosteus aculeatus aculeatus TaxID=481459 RepID=UPI001A99545A|nr:uncharacterized protein LOC120833538 [Gasterosteus aculeatus aculeatus]